MSVRRLAVVGAALIAAAVLATAALAELTSVKLGQTKQNYLCSAQWMWIQTAATDVSYVAPADGKLTKWLVNGGRHAGTMQFLVWRPAGGTDYTLRYISPRDNSHRRSDQRRRARSKGARTRR